MDETCKNRRSSLFTNLGGVGAASRFKPYDGRLDEQQVDVAPHIADIRLTRRADIIVTGDPSRVQKLGNAVVAIQKNLTANPNMTVDMRVSAFMDDCMHTTGWSTKPVDVNDALAEWHCYESETQLVHAFQGVANEHTRRGKIDSVFIVGHRFDEPVALVQTAASGLAKLDIMIHALVLGGQRLVAQYKAVTDVARGHAVRIANASAINEAMPILIFSMFPHASMRALPAPPKDPDVRRLAALLTPTTR
jgi:hypothetical protein